MDLLNYVNERIVALEAHAGKGLGKLSPLGKNVMTFQQKQKQLGNIAKKVMALQHRDE